MALSPKSPKSIDRSIASASDVELLCILGKGTFGSIHLARGKVTQEYLAVKVITDFAKEEQATLQEISLLQQCGHENVIQCYGKIIVGVDLWVALELAACGSLVDVMNITGKSFRNETQIAVLTRHILLGLHHIHSKKIVHRDVKGGNILLDAFGVAKLSDFGVAAQLTDASPTLKGTAGSPHWIAPEILNKLPYDEQVDIWSLGCTVIQIAEGNPPYHGLDPMKTMALMAAADPPPRFQLKDKWSPHLESLVTKCLVKDATSRPSASSLLTHDFVTATAQQNLKELADEVLLRKGADNSVFMKLGQSSDSSKKKGCCVQ